MQVLKHPFWPELRYKSNKRAMSSSIERQSQLGVTNMCLTDMHPYVAKVLSSPYLRRSRRLAKFLSYLVAQSLERNDPIKEYAIGIEVFGRDADFDPRLDPIVRVEARRLRAKLARYYSEGGAFDAIRIVMPARGYRLTFECAHTDEFRNDWLPADRPIRPISLAVLPFVSLNTKQSSQHFADGLTDEVSFQLASSTSLNLVARTSAFCFRGQSSDVTTIGAVLNADYILEGSVTQEGNTARVLVEIASTESGYRLWSGRYQEQAKPVLPAQFEIASKLVSDLRPVMEMRAHMLARGSRPNNAALLALYQKGRRYLNSRTEEGINQSIACFQRTIDSDSGFALGHAGLADSYSLGSRYHVLPPEKSWEKAQAAALEAVRIDGSLAEAYTSLAFVELHYLRNCCSAERNFCTAIQLNPRYVPAHQWYAWCLAASGRPQMAVANLRAALELDPLSPNVAADLALALYFSREYAATIAQCEKTLRFSPGFHRAHQSLGLAYLQICEYSKAIEHFQLASASSGRNSRLFAWMAQAYAAKGDTHAVSRLISEWRTVQLESIPAIDEALLSAAAGDYDRAFEWLERALSNDDGELIWLPVDPIYDTLRQDSRFSSLLKRIGPRQLGSKVPSQNMTL
jgi:TolB-like protein